MKPILNKNLKEETQMKALDFVMKNWKIGGAVLGGALLVGIANAIINKLGDDEDCYEEVTYYETETDNENAESSN